MRKISLKQILCLSLLAKLIFAIFFPIVADEAYYWVWGQNIQLSYFDHPGFVAWLTYLSSKMSFWIPANIEMLLPLGPQSFSVRLLFSLLSFLTFCVWLKIFNFERNKNNTEMGWFSLFYHLNPLLGFGSVLITPDAPLLLFWGLAYYSFLKIIKNQQLKDYVFLGIFLGLGFCSKYHIVLFPVCAFISLAVSKKLQDLRFKGILLTFVFGLTFSLPVLIWNYQNDFVSFKFQLNHGFSGQGYSLWWTTTYILGQVALFNPFLFIQPYKALKKFRSLHAGQQLALYQWLFFFYSSFKAKVEANWPLTSHATYLASLNFTSFCKKRALFYFISLWLLFFTYLLTPLGSKKINSLPTSLVIHKLDLDFKKFMPLYSCTYQLSSLLYLMSETPVYKHRDFSRVDFYNSLEQSLPQEAKFYFLKYKSMEWVSSLANAKKTLLKENAETGLELYEVIRE